MLRIHDTAVIIIVCLILLTGGTAFSAAVYQWVDREGVTHIQDQNSGSVPEGAAVEQKNLPDARQAVAPTHQVEIYTTSSCHYCHDAKAYLKKRGIPFAEHDVEKDPEAMRRRNTLSPSGGVPIAVIDGKVVRGFSVEIYDGIFGTAP